MWASIISGIISIVLVLYFEILKPKCKKNKIEKELIETLNFDIPLTLENYLKNIYYYDKTENIFMLFNHWNDIEPLYYNFTNDINKFVNLKLFFYQNNLSIKDRKIIGTMIELIKLIQNQPNDIKHIRTYKIYENYYKLLEIKKIINLETKENILKFIKQMSIINNYREQIKPNLFESIYEFISHFISYSNDLVFFNTEEEKNKLYDSYKRDIFNRHFISSKIGFMISSQIELINIIEPNLKIDKELKSYLSIFLLFYWEYKNLKSEIEWLCPLSYSTPEIKKQFTNWKETMDLLQIMLDLFCNDFMKKYKKEYEEYKIIKDIYDIFSHIFYSIIKGALIWKKNFDLENKNKDV